MKMMIIILLKKLLFLFVVELEDEVIGEEDEVL